MSRNILVTGGTSGIGFASAVRLSREEGTRIVLNGRNPERGEAALRRLAEQAPGCNARFVAADVSGQEGAASLMAAAGEHLDGGIDVLVNAAGGDHAPAIFTDTSLDDIDAMIRHWLSATLYCCQLALPLIRRGGAIVNVASDAAKVPTPGEAVVGAAMAGIVMFSRTLAMEAKRQGVRVNVVTPSLVTGTLTYDRITAGGFSAKLFEKATKAAHLGLPEADDVAAAIAFLASPDAARMTGQVISVNGGISAG